MSIREGFIDGPVLPSPEPIPPNSFAKITLTVKHTSSSDVASSSTVLDSQDETLVNNLNESMRQDSEHEGNSEKYDYKLDASTTGKVDWDVTAVDWRANLDLKGATNDERKRFSEAAKKAVDKQITRTAAARTQSVREITAASHSTDSTETVIERTVRNDSNSTLNLVLCRLRESVKMLMALKNVEIVFSNGVEMDRAPLSRLRRLLDHYLADDATKQVVEGAIRKELQRVRNYRGDPVNCLNTPDADTIAFDPDIKTTFTATNGQRLEVRGIVIADESFAPLTDAVILKVIESRPTSL